MQIIGPHLRPTESEALGVSPAICVLTSPPGGPDTLRFKNHWVSGDPYKPAVRRASKFPTKRHAEAGHSVGHTLGVCSQLLLFLSLVIRQV